MTRPSLPPINFAALAQALLARSETLVAAWLPGGKVDGHEYKCANLSGGAGHKNWSCSVNLRTGAWADFATDEKGGDLVSLYAAIHSLEMGKAAAQVARECGLEDVAGVLRDGQQQGEPPPAPAPRPTVRRDDDKERWHSVTPVPPDAPAPTFWHKYRTPDTITHKAAYHIDGQLFGYVVRFRTSDGGKEPIPYVYAKSARDGGMAWKWKMWDEPRPLYFPGGKLPAAHTVVLVEGEKKADALHALLQAAMPDVYCVASWPGGCNAWAKALWALLANNRVLAWPDCDAKRVPLSAAERKACANDAALAAAQAAKPLLLPERQPGMRAMLAIGRHLRDEYNCKVQLLPIPAPGAVKDGWDCDDAITADGWDAARVLEFFGRAQPLPQSADGAPPPPPSKSKKRDGPVDTGGGDDGAGRTGPKDPPEWLLPFWDEAKSRWMVSRKLVIKALMHDPALAGVLGFNELSNAIDARLDWPWPYGRAGPITGSTDLALGLYLSERYGLPAIARAALSEAIETIAHRQRFHPIREYLERQQWDGKPRVDRWLIYVLGCHKEQLRPALREYLTLVGRFWLLGMVNRVMEPGCKFDYCPVLEGPGGLRKSTLVQALASKAFFSASHFDVGRGHDGQEQVQGLWLYEIAELANFGKSDIGLIKSFISNEVDKYRPAYGRVQESYPRQCVMVGTTNERTYLRDRTGNRRFWPVPVRTVINTDWVVRWRDQLFAEALMLYREGAPFAPSPADEKRLFEPMQESRLIDTAVQSELLRLLTREVTQSELGMLVNCETPFVTMADLVRVLGADAAKSNAGLEAQIRGWMEHEGWAYARRRVNGARAMGYLRPAGWPPDGDDDDDAPMDAPVTPKPQAPPAGDDAGAAEPDDIYGDAEDAPF